VTTVSGAGRLDRHDLVDPVWRGRGIGKALTQATIDAAEVAGCRLVLVATDAGRSLYERSVHGADRLPILEAPGLGSAPPTNGSDLPAVRSSGDGGAGRRRDRGGSRTC
jgi:GNAT superfamily N-acetyltransferase